MPAPRSVKAKVDRAAAEQPGGRGTGRAVVAAAGVQHQAGDGEDDGEGEQGQSDPRAGHGGAHVSGAIGSAIVPTSQRRRGAP